MESAAAHVVRNGVQASHWSHQRLSELSGVIVRIDSHESGDSRESEIWVIRANLQMIRANRFARIALRIARATKFLKEKALFPCKGLLNKDFRV